MNRLSRRLATTGALAAAFILAGCVGGSPRQEPRRLVLSYQGALPAADIAAKPRLVVRAVAVPDYLDRRELLRRTGSAEVAPLTGAVWAERPSKSLTRWLTQALAAARSDYAVQALTTVDGRAPDAVLAVNLEDFAPGSDGTLRLRGSWVWAPQGARSSLSGRFDADAPTANSSPEASVAALQAALQQAVKALASQLPAAPAPAGAAPTAP